MKQAARFAQVSLVRSGPGVSSRLSCALRVSVLVAWWVVGCGDSSSESVRRDDSTAGAAGASADGDSQSPGESGGSSGSSSTALAGSTAGSDGRDAGTTSGSGGSGPIDLCGNGTCSSVETCGTCEADCGVCTDSTLTECNDGTDNDGDGLVDWQYDMGCYGAQDTTEVSLSRSEEDGWTTFDLSSDSRVVYVSSSDGDDSADGLSPETAVASPARGAQLVRDGSPDFLLFKRGDIWRGQDLGPDRVVRRFKSGLDADHPIVVSSYGDSVERPRFEIDKHFIDHDGNERSYVAIVGLAFISYPKVPGDRDFNGADGGALRLIGPGHDILVEDNYVEYGEFVVQNGTDVAFRRNVVYRSYHVDTCAYNSDGSRNPNGDSTYRPSGVFCGGVDGLLIEGNVWDENGWNPDVDEACATIYDHNLYLSGNARLTVRNNLILRASSIGIKMASEWPGESNDILIENNLFAEGEIGLSMGGNAEGAYRFVNAEVVDNVFTDIGRSQPTTRELSWYIDLIDNDGTTVARNLLVHQPPLANSYGIRLSGGTQRDVAIRDNLVYGLSRRQVWVEGASAWSSISVTGNAFLCDAREACLVLHEGGFAAFDSADNAYSSVADAETWFCVDETRASLEQWRSLSGESGATLASQSAEDPQRNLDSFATHLGVGSTLADFAAAARQQSRHHYRPELSAVHANNYIREGFGMATR